MVKLIKKFESLTILGKALSISFKRVPKMLNSIIGKFPCQAQRMIIYQACKVHDFKVQTSVVDPNTLNLDPVSGFWPNLDPDPGLYRYYEIVKKKITIVLEKNNFL